MQSFPARETDLHQIVDHVERAASALALPRDFVLRLCLVVEELFVNTARYARGASASVGLVSDAAGVWLEYSDTGPAYDPFEALAREALSRALEQRPVGGLGRILVHDLSTSARYERVDERNVLRLRFEFAAATRTS